MKKRRIFRTVIIVLIMILLVASPALAEATRTEWTEQNTTCDYYCSLGEGQCESYSANGKIMHGRGFVQYIRALRFDPNSPNLDLDPEWHGWTTSIVNFDLNLETGHGTSWGTFVREYDLKDGTFEGTWSGQINEFVFSGKLVGHGTGELEGQLVKGWVNNFLNEDLPLDLPCEPDELFGSVNNGYILDPHGE